MRRWLIATATLLALGGIALFAGDEPPAGATGSRGHAPAPRHASIASATPVHRAAAPGDAGATPSGPDAGAREIERLCRTVRVLDRGPVSDALVLLSAPVDAPPTEHRTGRDGQVEVCAQPDSLVSVEAYDAAGRWNRLTGRWRDTDRAVELVLMEPPTIDVHVVDASGAPVAGARVLVTDNPMPATDGSDDRSTRHLAIAGRAAPLTDRDGRASIALGRVGLFWILADRHDLLPRRSERIFARPDERQAVEIALDPAVRLCGTLDVEGRPPEDGWAELGHERVDADSDGRFCFERRIGAEENARVRCGAPGALTEVRRVPATEHPQISLRPAGHIRVELRPGPLLARCDEAGIATVAVTGGGVREVAETDEGAVTVGPIPEGEVEIRVTMHGLDVTAQGRVRAGEESEARVEVPVPAGWGLLQLEGPARFIAPIDRPGLTIHESCAALPAGAYSTLGEAEVVGRVHPGAVTRVPRPEPAAPADPAGPPRVIHLDDIEVVESCRPEIWLVHDDARGAMVSFAWRARTQLLPGDVVLSIDGAGPDLEALYAAALGDRDSVATLVVERDGRRFTERLPRTRCGS